MSNFQSPYLDLPERFADSLDSALKMRSNDDVAVALRPLPPVHERILAALLALSVQPRGRTELARMLGRAGARIPRKKRRGGQLADEAPSAGNIQPILNHWQQEGRLKMRRDEWSMYPDAAYQTLEMLAEHDAGTISDAADLIRSNLYDWGSESAIVSARCALYVSDETGFEAALRNINQRNRASKSAPLPFFEVMNPVMAAQFVDRIPVKLRPDYLDQAFEFLIRLAIPTDKALAQHALELKGSGAARIRASACILYDLLGMDAGLGAIVEADAEAPALEAMALRHLIRGDNDKAYAAIERAWTASMGPGQRRKPRLQTPVAPLLTMVATTGGPALKAIATAQPSSPGAKGAPPIDYAPVCWLVESEGKRRGLKFSAEEWMSLLMTSLALIWSNDPSVHLQADLPGILVEIGDELEEVGFGWIGAQMNICAKTISNKAKSPPGGLVSLQRQREVWEIKLDALEADLVGRSSAPDAATVDERLVWIVEPPIERDLDYPLGAMRFRVEARVQKRRKKGWTTGRTVSLKRLSETEPDVAWMTPEDQRVISTISLQQNYYERYYFFTDRVATMLVGHPRVFWSVGDSQPIEVVSGDPALVVDRQPNRIQLRVEPPPPLDSVWWSRTAPYQLTVYSLTDDQRRISDRIGKGLELPMEAESRVQKLVAHAARLLPVHTDLIADSEKAEAREADPRPVIAIDRSGDGIRLQIAVHPLGLDGPRLRVGHGNSSIVATVEDKIVRCERDLSLEQQHLERLRDRCPSLSPADNDDRIELSDVFDALEVLDELRDLEDEAIIVWQTGKRLSVSPELNDGALRMSLRKEASEWFSASGSVQADEAMVVDLQVLLDLLPKRRGRFVPIDDAKFVALSDSLLSKLHALSAVQSDSADETADGIRLPAVAAGLVTSWASDLMALEVDKASQKRLARARAATALQPEVPSTFEAELRPYQQEGYQWLVRLAHWGAGACLADDMGLGKTVQALALLLHRADQGPALVVAPTSVCSGWMEQALQFAPTLRCALLNGAPDADEVLQPYDVLVVSYTMMAIHIDALAETSFATVVLDEAQAIKNASTQRAKAARRLKGEFRLATTGTPVENHLGELWSLMTFLNPGLLGTAKSFERRFGRGGRSDAPERLDQLKSLMRPFVLRRKKRDVLKELPPRTEIVVEVEPSPEEQAFSEALRRRALERLESGAEDFKKNAMTVLAELTRLRQAACHPALVDPETSIGSSKLAHLMELARGLIEGRHRMLIFSQFVQFLKLVQAEFDRAGVTYQYLDGSTPRAERDKAVQAFQAGQGDAFIISLKAGGTGLNLTGADYVIHLDPWWNPAVDDQASSRAHRIGQLRPVTVYKLVTKGSVEEKVYSLHAEKRDLAERLLVGAEVASTPDLETLMAVLTGEP